ncbi:MAG: hypothetical protein H5U22_06640 [Rhizobium sp.]|nr:hypothetical protein [Rhizobium sp.]
MTATDHAASPNTTPPLDYVPVDPPESTKTGAFFIAFFIAGLLMGGLLTSLVSA